MGAENQINAISKISKKAREEEDEEGKAFLGLWYAHRQ